MHFSVKPSLHFQHWAQCWAQCWREMAGKCWRQHWAQHWKCKQSCWKEKVAQQCWLQHCAKPLLLGFRGSVELNINKEIKGIPQHAAHVRVLIAVYFKATRCRRWTSVNKHFQHWRQCWAQHWAQHWAQCWKCKLGFKFLCVDTHLINYLCKIYLN